MHNGIANPEGVYPGLRPDLTLSSDPLEKQPARPPFNCGISVVWFFPNGLQ